MRGLPTRPTTGEGFGNDFGSELHRTNAVAALMRVNLLKRMESSVSAFRTTLVRVRSSCADILDRLAVLDARDVNDAVGSVAVGYGIEGLEDGLDDQDAEMFEVGAQIARDLRDVDARLCPWTSYATLRFSTNWSVTPVQ